VRFLPEYDNVVLSHDDRSRFFDQAHRAALAQGWTIGWGSVLHDGVAVGVWRLEPEGLVVRHVEGLSKKALAAIAAEGRRLARFLEAESSDVRLVALSP
jgi:hypothetical protein